MGLTVIKLRDWKLSEYLTRAVFSDAREKVALALDDPKITHFSRAQKFHQYRL